MAGYAATDTPASLQQPLSPLFSPFSRKYATISSSEQRQSYKNDFNAEYSEYRDLHARIEQITRRFTQLDAQLRQLSQGSEEYEVELPVGTLPWEMGLFPTVQLNPRPPNLSAALGEEGLSQHFDPSWIDRWLSLAGHLVQAWVWALPWEPEGSQPSWPPLQ